MVDIICDNVREVLDIITAKHEFIVPTTFGVIVQNKEADEDSFAAAAATAVAAPGKVDCPQPVHGLLQAGWVLQCVLYSGGEGTGGLLDRDQGTDPVLLTFNFDLCESKFCK